MHEGYFSFVTEATLLPGFRPHFAEIDGVRTRYFLGGEGPPLTMVHGLGGAAVNFTKLAPILARRRRVLIPDLPGHGLSEPFRHVEGIATYSRHVHKVAELEGMLPGAVLGYSMGGVVALRLAVEEPEDVTALALVAPAGIVSTTRRAEIWLAVTAAHSPCAGDDALPGHLRAPAEAPLAAVRPLGRGRSRVARSRRGPRLPRRPFAAHRRRQRGPRPARRRPSSRPRPRPLPCTSSSGAPATGSCRSETASSTRAGCVRRSVSSLRPGTSSSASSPSRARRFSKGF